jgi:hypothetical protein
VVKEKYTNRREHREDTELTEKYSASSVVKNSNSREYRENIELIDSHTAPPVVKNSIREA